MACERPERRPGGSGQTAQYSLQVNPGTGFSGNISMSCSGLPLAATTRSRVVPVLLLIGVFAGGIAGCGGASNPTTPPPQQVVTPKGSFIIIVTATAGTLPPQTISLTLNVN